ncbi:hypothetical protein HW555_009171 [Spodoptera exigua]|uniref:Rab GTPase-activating protein 1-like n=1 Tax=Spodoptera exigua TaxID=7107 RepID=A0A835L108_SPOEX|nr:hypothetical protein HW555_009171 [Spodoptera exigua]
MATIIESCRLVGGSKFYEMMDSATSADVSTPSPTEKHDHMKPTESDDEDVDQECTRFSGVSYLGAQNISDPKSESDIQRIMKELSSMPESRDGIAVSISIPVCSQGLVVLYQADSNNVMTRYAVNRISFYARGAAGSPVASCFAFTWSHGETKESAVYRCHVFRCHIAEAVNQVSMDSTCIAGTFSHVPKERLGFKLRGGIDKQVTINVKQVTNNVQPESDDPQSTYTGGLYIERCFGILLAPGRSVKHSDMRLLEMVSGSSGGSGCSVCALWNAGESALAAFNVASGDGAPAYMSLALDLVIRGIPDPLRLVIETPVKIFPPTERFWYYSKRPLVQQFYINLKESVDALGQLQYEVASIETSDELDRSRLNLPLSLSSLLPSPLSSAPAPPSPSEPDSDGDEPLLSGTGEVSKDCGEDVLVNWAQDCPFEAVIQRDIARTFPAHDFFREAGGLGQDSLLRMARAYAVYDHEVGYCQGLSFLAATLLLHMPEEQAFCLLVRLMYGYGLRELYKDGFEALYMRLHQLDRLMEEQLTDLRAHFQELGVEPHMFASQWFLTVFTARFPLPLVYHILDVFLLQGIDTLFQVALALLSRSRKDLLQHDFEGVLKYFRVTLPKKCRAEESSRQIVKLACSIKVKRLPKYQQEYEKFIKESAEKEKINVELERLKVINTQLLQEKELLEAQLTEVQDQKGDDKEGSSETEARLRQRVRDLELELAQVKLAHVQAQCSNQELSHQLTVALNEVQAAVNQKQTVAPWLVRTLNSIMEAAQTRPSFQTYLPNSNSEQPATPLHRQGSFSSGQSHSHGNLDRRVSEPYSPDVVRRKKDLNASKRHSLLVESNLAKEAKEINRRSHDVTIVKNLSMG